ncbi:MAG: hypothetical protein KIS85_08325 [Anaerolineales bacterium]|nr:hypothetical protein [Anaerolineales bacterium]
MAEQPPYKPSWVDRLMDYMDQSPLPTWVFYVLIYAAIALSLHLALWVSGNAPWGTLVSSAFRDGYVPLVLASLHHLRGVAGRSVDRYAPLVKKRSAELAALRYQMTTMPARTVFWITVVLLVLVPIVTAEAIAAYTSGPSGAVNPLAFALVAPGFLGYVAAFLLIYSSIRRLNLVPKAYALLEDVDIFHQQPLYAFSTLTMRTGGIMIGLLYLVRLLGTLQGVTLNPIDVALSFVIITLGILLFILPLLGLQERLAEAKLAELEKNGLQIKKAQGKMYAALEADRSDDVRMLNTGISSLYKMREQLKDIPTWPWAPGALRNFLSAVLLPMVLWGMQVVLERFLTF